MNKKKLDKLFQDKFSDFKEMPDEKVWNSIEASLDKKKKKRMLPIWWQLGGVAALILIGLIVFNPFAATDTHDAIITDVEKYSTVLDSTKVDASEEISQEEVKVAVEDEKTSDINEHNEGIVDTSEKTIEENEAKSNQLRKNSHLVEKGSRAEDKGLAVTEEGMDSTKETKSQSEIDIVKSHIDKTEVAVTDVESNNENPRRFTENSLNKESDQKEAVATLMNKQNDIAATESKERKETIIGSEGKSIFEEIENQEEKAVTEQSANKWSAGPSIAPVYFNAIGDGSPVHSIFVPNSKSGDVNLSYGLSVAYEVSSKLKIRSGIHRVDYGYNTNDVEFSSSLASSTNGQINSINYAANSKNLVVTSKTGDSRNLDVSNSAIDASAQNLAREGIMSQQLGYLEVPLELNYALLDKKFGVNIIGGFSSLFLVDNSVALTSGELTTEMGEANNVNSTNFSTNIGLGVNYKFSSKIQLNVEPIFKYQLNTFSETAGNFRPYSIGVYSGLSFKF
ncbi:hypothetical protein [Maribacter aestuarii]|uniref:hypothetical protein n=1 Tax=Maribacter aestuarii TaxID=1130723 RepID=UPI0025A5D6F1|nr:hypothetical protein [Maribacter aestuarii]